MPCMLLVLSHRTAVLHALQVVIADDRQAGYFLHIWRRLSWPHPLRILRKQPFPDNTCFSKAIIAPYAAHAQSLLTYKAGSVDEVLCESVVLQATSRWLRQLFRDLLPLSLLHANRRAAADAKVSSEDQHTTTESRQQQTDSSGRHGDSTASSRPMQLSGAEGRYRDLAPLEPSPTQSAAPLELLYVVWLSRRRFEQQHAAELTSWQKARVLSQQQQQELVLGLQQAVLKWNAQTCVTAEEKECKARSVMFGLQVSSHLPHGMCAAVFCILYVAVVRQAQPPVCCCIVTYRGCWVNSSSPKSGQGPAAQEDGMKSGGMLARPSPQPQP